MRYSSLHILLVLVGAWALIKVSGFGSAFSRIISQHPIQSNGKEMAAFDVLTTTVVQLQKLLETNQVSGIDVVKTYLSQIDKHNIKGMGLHAMISIAPVDQLLEQAHQLDEERKRTGARGPLHGIPLIVKDSYLTGTLGMGTTCGSFALKGAKSSQNAHVIDALIKAGMIIIGKANLSEWGAFKAERQRAGWSAVGGQTVSPYVRGGVLPNATFLGHSVRISTWKTIGQWLTILRDETPCGSSSGSAVGVAAGFGPVAIGTETDGSVVQPSTRAALYGLKCTVGLTENAGISSISSAFDSLGAMAKSTADLSAVLEVLMESPNLFKSQTGTWTGLSVGFVDPSLWQPADFVVEPNEGFRKQTFAAMNRAADMIKAKEGGLHQPVPLISLNDACRSSGYELEDLMTHDFPPSLQHFLSYFSDVPVKNLAELIEFNEKHADIEMPDDHPGQQALLGARDSKMTLETFNSALGSMRSTARAAINKTLSDYKIDVILGPADARIASVAAVAGYPVASLPLGFADFNGRAFGMNMIAEAGNEAKMLEVMNAWEKTFPEARAPPPMLAQWGSKKETSD